MRPSVACIAVRAVGVTAVTNELPACSAVLACGAGVLGKQTPRSMMLQALHV